MPWQLLDRQFQLATSWRPSEAHLSMALAPANRHKNRSVEHLPLDRGRVPLANGRYVNASFVPGFRAQAEFLVTQHPTEHTAADMWQMLWEHNARTVVVITHMQEPVRYVTLFRVHIS